MKRAIIAAVLLLPFAAAAGDVSPEIQLRFQLGAALQAQAQAEAQRDQMRDQMMRESAAGAKTGDRACAYALVDPSGKVTKCARTRAELGSTPATSLSR